MKNHAQPQQPSDSPDPAAPALTEPQPAVCTRYEQLVCGGCGHRNAPRPTTHHHTLPCTACGQNRYRRLVIIALEPSELQLLIDLAEQASSTGSHELLETLYAAKPYTAQELPEPVSASNQQLGHDGPRGAAA